MSVSPVHRGNKLTGGLETTGRSATASEMPSSAQPTAPNNSRAHARGLSGSFPRMPMTTARSTERTRLALVLFVTISYVAVLVSMFYLNTLSPGMGFTAGQVSENTWRVTQTVPGGPAMDAEIYRGDTLLQVNGKPVSEWSGLSNFRGATSATVQRVGQEKPVVVTPMDDSANPFRRWTYALLGLFFISVGGPVLIKARQRPAALTFYTFCVSTAMAFAFAIGTASASAVAYAMTFISLVLFGSSFILFFFEFPLAVGKNYRQHVAIVSAVILIAAGVLASYILVLVVDAHYYKFSRAFMLLFLAGCVTGGLMRMVNTLLTTRDTEIRQQLILLVGGTAFAVLPALLLSVLPSIFTLKPIVNMEFTAVALGFMPLAFAYAITQHQLLGVRNFVRRGVVYVIMGSGVLLVFSLSAAALNIVMQDGWEHSEGGLIGFGFFVFLIAFSYSRLQSRVEFLVDRYIYHDAYDYKEALLQFSSQLASEQKLQILGDQLVERTCRLMNLTCGVLLIAVEPDDDAMNAAKSFRSGGLSTGMLSSGALSSGVLSGSMIDEVDLGETTGTTGPLPLVTDAAAWRRQVGLMKVHAPHASNGNNTIYLQICASYGEVAPHMIDGLRGELARFGIRLHQSEDVLSSLAAAGAQVTGNAQAEQTNAGDGLFQDGQTSYVSPYTGVVAETAANEIGTNDRTEIMAARGDIDTLRSFLGVPLWTRSRFVGVLCLAGKKTGERFTKDDLSLLSTLGSQAALAIYNAQLHEAREQALIDTIAALAHAIEAKDGYTIQHCENMTGRAVALAQALGLARQDVENVRLGAILHDVGKIGIPDAVLNKPGKLTSEEYEIIKQHAAIGARIVQNVGALQGVVPIVHHHQERYDGSGYPGGLAGEAIPIGARIIGVVDTYGAMTEDRIYRKAPGHTAALTELQRLAGKQFDPTVVTAFVKLLEDYPEFGEAGAEIAASEERMLAL